MDLIRPSTSQLEMQILFNMLGMMVNNLSWIGYVKYAYVGAQIILAGNLG